MRQEHRSHPIHDIARIAVVIVALATSLFAASIALGDADPGARSSLLMRILAGSGISALVVVIIMRLKASGDMDGMNAGLGAPRPAFTSFGLGVAAWTLPAVAIFLVLALLDHRLEMTTSASEFAGRVVLLALAVLLSEAIPEELVFRGYITGVLNRHLAPWPTIAIQTALFTGTTLLLRGFPGIGDVSLFITMGIIFGYFQLVTGTIWTSVGFHTAFQTGAQLLLTHDVLQFTGPPGLELLAVGTGPFIAAFLIISRSAGLREKPAPT